MSQNCCCVGIAARSSCVLSIIGPTIGPVFENTAHQKMCRQPHDRRDILPILADPHSRRQNDLDIVDHWDHMWPKEMHYLLHQYLLSVDELPHHFQLHFMHAAEILGYQHHLPEVRQWWHECYLRLVEDLHLSPESDESMNARLSDSEDQWRSFGGVRAL